MRRLWAAAAAILVWLALGGLPAAAQEASESPSESPAAPPEPALVTGTERCFSGSYSSRDEGGVVLGHIPTFKCTNEASDPRVSGPAQGEFWSACYATAGCVYWGTYEIAGPDGTWSGLWSGTDDAVLDLRSYLVTVEGSGAYEGWTFVAHWQDRFGTSTFSGLIYPGPPPPWPEAPTD